MGPTGGSSGKQHFKLVTSINMMKCGAEEMGAGGGGDKERLRGGRVLRGGGGAEDR